MDKEVIEINAMPEGVSGGISYLVDFRRRVLTGKEPIRCLVLARSKEDMKKALYKQFGAGTWSLVSGVGRDEVQARVEHLESIRVSLDAISNGIAHYVEIPDAALNWAHVGTLAHLAEQLEDVAEMFEGVDNG